jgi:hypothetical protein
MASDLVYHAQREPDQRTPLNMHCEYKAEKEFGKRLKRLNGGLGCLFLITGDLGCLFLRKKDSERAMKFTSSFPASLALLFSSLSSYTARGDRETRTP